MKIRPSKPYTIAVRIERVERPPQILEVEVRKVEHRPRTIQVRTTRQARV